MEQTKLEENKMLEKIKDSTLDNDTEILNFFFDNREEFVVDFDPEKVDVKEEKGTIRFILKD